MTNFLSPLLMLAIISGVFAQGARNPRSEAQKNAMKKLSFLAGKWSGKATVRLGPGEPIELIQTEDIEYRLDGTILLIEGTGRDPKTGQVLFNAVGVVSYDAAKSVYEIRAYSDGRKVDSLLETDGAGFAWGFDSGPAQIRHVMKLTEKGEWSETTTAQVGDKPAMTSVQMLLQKLK
jgi:hypothetical protein